MTKSLALIATFAGFAAGAATAQKLSPEKVYPRFPVGPTGLFATIEKGNAVTVQEVAPGSPAVASQLRAGDVLLSAMGEPLAADDPRVVLGRAIAAAEAGDGSLRLTARGDGAEREVRIVLAKLGAYSATWPERCAKSAAIIGSAAAFVAGAQRPDGSYDLGGGRAELGGLGECLASLFLLSTGDREHLPRVARHARALAAAVEARPTLSNWHIGYQGILLAEYYLQTGDKSVLGGLGALCDRATSAQVAGGWGHRGIPGPGYTQSGLMNSAGVPVLTTLILAAECGVEIDPGRYAEAVEFMYRMVGHGCVPYGDHRSELWWSNTNGRNAKLACAFALFDDPRFKDAAGLLATMVADSYFQPEFGHTGGGFNVIWRGMASVHVPEHRRAHYAREMDKLAWYYDLCRLHDGGFFMLPTPPDNGRYAGPVWGTGAIGLTYTAPLRKLRILGAAPGRFSVTTEPPAFAWGSAADRAFLSTRDAEGFGAEAAEPHAVYHQTIGDAKGSASVAFCAQHLRHFNPVVRAWAGRVLGGKGSPEAEAAVAEALAHGDPRVRRAAFDTISGYDNWRRPFKPAFPPATVSAKFLVPIVATLDNPRAAWWEIDGALFALGAAAPDDIRAHRAAIDRFAAHEEWYLREAAFWALAGLHATMTDAEFQTLADRYANSRHVFERSSYDAAFRMILKSDRAAFDRMTEQAVARTLGATVTDVPIVPEYGEAAVHEAAHRTMMVTKHFPPRIYGDMIPELARYLKIWNPYHQHSVWMISGSKWQPGILNIIEDMGAEAEPIIIELDAILARYDRFDPERNGRAAAGLRGQIAEAVAAWKRKLG